MSFGVTFRETMRGTYYLLAEPTTERAMSFALLVAVKGLASFVRDPVARIEGHVSMAGFAEDASLEGTLAFRLHDQRRLVYEFRFEAEDGHPYRFRGQKDVTPLAPIESFITLPGSIYDESSKEIGRAMVFFDLRGDIRRFLRSFRFMY